MLTKKQHQLLMFIDERLNETGVSPSFDEMKDALALKSKSGVHRLITALEERGFIRRLPHRARALEVLKRPEPAPPAPKANKDFRPSVVDGGFHNMRPAQQTPGRQTPGRQTPASTLHAGDSTSLPVLGRIAAGTPIEAIQQEVDRIDAPTNLMRAGEHFILEVQGESMIDAGIHDGDLAIIQKTNDAPTGEIVVALVDGEEATLKRLRKKGASIALEAANPRFETRIYGSERIAVQGKLVGLMRKY